RLSLSLLFVILLRCLLASSRLFRMDFSSPRRVPSLPTRRSSDLDSWVRPLLALEAEQVRAGKLPSFQSHMWDGNEGSFPARTCSDRKSTRLNSSHVSISYAVFCLKKKNTY